MEEIRLPMKRGAMEDIGDEEVCEVELVRLWKGDYTR